jgi:hypothetical protein
MGNEPVQGDPSDRIGLDKIKKDSKRISSDWLLMPVHDSTIKTLILFGFFACALSSIIFGGVSYLKAKSEGSEREAIGLITNIMSGITGIAAGVFTSGNLR